MPDLLNDFAKRRHLRIGNPGEAKTNGGRALDKLKAGDCGALVRLSLFKEASMRGLRVLALILLLFPGNAYAQQKPNIVLVLMDNLGWGEPGVYGGGILRGAPTPRIDQLAAEGMRLLNYNVEAAMHPEPCGSDDWAVRNPHGQRLGADRYSCLRPRAVGNHDG